HAEIGVSYRVHMPLMPEHLSHYVVHVVFAHRVRIRRNSISQHVLTPPPGAGIGCLKPTLSSELRSDCRAAKRLSIFPIAIGSFPVAASRVSCGEAEYSLAGRNSSHRTIEKMSVHICSPGTYFGNAPGPGTAVQPGTTGFA